MMARRAAADPASDPQEYDQLCDPGISEPTTQNRAAQRTGGPVMSEAAAHDCAILLTDNIRECAAVGAHYLRLVAEYANVNDQAGMRYSLKCGLAHLRAAIESFRELEKLATLGNGRKA
jgi:hypothetical protein